MIRSLAPSGNLTFKVVRAKGPGFWWHFRNRARLYFIWGWLAYTIAPLLARLFGFMVVTSRLQIVLRRANGDIVSYGSACYRVVTTAMVNAMAASFINTASPGNFYYHGLGTGTGNEAVGDTALGTELTTEYSADNTRPTGTHVQGASANIYRSVGTVTIDSGTPAVTEHGVFNQAANSGGTLMDRSKFAAVNMSSGDSFQATYELTFTAGG